MESADSHLKDVFSAARERPAGPQRATYLETACGGDDGLRRRVLALLEAYDLGENFLTSRADGEVRPLPAAGSTLPPDVAGPGAVINGADSFPTPLVPERIEAQIGPYKLIRTIGEGGMGTVFLAEQEQPVRRTVALKVIKPGLDTAQVVARFEAERQALALMNHPNIARVFDAGTTARGRLYFVMELVEGEAITEYCDRANLTPRERLKLFLPVCRAIQHAHQKGVIHRDIKPSNVLISHQDGRPVPKVIDFGVAKATDQRLTERTLCTQFGMIVGTLEYMSPEQAATETEDVDTRSDVYSLGVVLYELLTGTTPLERRTLRQAAYAEVLRRIREEEPPKPSTRLGGSGEALAAIAALRQTEPSRLPRLLRGELDWIVMKALEKDRARRYETANGFARDVERYLADEAVEACPPSPGYRAWKFARKHRQLLASAGAFGVLLVLGAVLSTWQAVRATRAEPHARAERNRAVAAEQSAREQRDGATNARDAEVRSRLRAEGAERQAHQERDKAVAQQQRADVEASTANAVNRFLQQDLLAQADPYIKGDPNATPDPDMKVRTLLDRAASSITGKFRDAPLVEASIHQTIAQAYGGLALHAKAEEHAERALVLRLRTLGEAHPDTLSAINSVALAYSHNDRLVEAEKLDVKLVKDWSRVGGENHPSTLDAMSNLACVFRDQYKLRQAEELLVKVVESKGRILGKHDASTLISVRDLATVFRKQGKLKKAELLLLSVAGDAALALGENHPGTLASKSELARSYQAQGRNSDAEPLFVQALEGRRRVLGDDHPDTRDSLNTLAELLSESLSSSPARPATWRVLVNGFEAAVKQEPGDVSLRHSLGVALLLAGDREGYRRARAATLLRFAGSKDAWAGPVARACVLGPDRSDDGSAPVKMAEAAVAKYPSRKSWWLYVLGLAHHRAGHEDEAIRILRRSIDEHPRWRCRALSCAALALAHHQLGHTDEARRWLDKARNLKGDSSRNIPRGEAMGPSASWLDRGELQILCQEADTLIRNMDFPDDPFQR